MKTYLLYHQLGNTVKADIALNNLALCFAVSQLLVGAKALFQVFNFGDGSPNVMANDLTELSSRFKEVTFIMLIKNFSWIYWLKLLKDGSATFPPKTPPHSLGPGFHECMISIESPPLAARPFSTVAANGTVLGARLHHRPSIFQIRYEPEPCVIR